MDTGRTAALLLAKCEADVIHGAETCIRVGACTRIKALAVTPYVRRQQHGCHLACVSSPLFLGGTGSQDFAGRNEKRLVLIALIHDGAQLSL